MLTAFVLRGAEGENGVAHSTGGGPYLMMHTMLVGTPGLFDTVN